MKTMSTQLYQRGHGLGTKTEYCFQAKSRDNGTTLHQISQLDWESCRELFDVKEDTTVRMLSNRNSIWAAKIDGSTSAHKPILSITKVAFSDLKRYSYLSNEYDTKLAKDKIGRGCINDQCFLLVDQSWGGLFEDHNLYPYEKCSEPDTANVWKFIKEVMKDILVLLGDTIEVTLVVRLDYDNPLLPERPTNFTFIFRFGSSKYNLSKVSIELLSFLQRNLNQPLTPREFETKLMELKESICSIKSIESNVPIPRQESVLVAESFKYAWWWDYIPIVNGLLAMKKGIHYWREGNKRDAVHQFVNGTSSLVFNIALFGSIAVKITDSGVALGVTIAGQIFMKKGRRMF